MSNLQKKCSYLLLPLLMLFIVGNSTAQVASIQQAIRNGASFLEHTQKENGSICDTNNTLFDTWETILAAKALQRIYQDTTRASIKAALRYLKANENNEGLICHNQKCRQSYCLETTAEYFSLRQMIHDTSMIQEKLRKIVEMQDPKGYWEIGNPDVTEQKTFPSVTAFVINLLHSYKIKATYEDAAYQYIKTTQLKDGSWGRHWEYYNTPAYALWQCMAMLRNQKNYSAEYYKALQFVLSSQKADGSWNYPDSANVRNISPLLHTALMASCLMHEKDKHAKRALAKAVGYLLSHQNNDGSWNGGFFPINNQRYRKEEYIFATSQSLLVLQNFLEQQK